MDLVNWRKRNGYTQPQLAEKLGVRINTIYRWEKGMRQIPPFLHLALETLERKGGEEGSRDTKMEKGGHENG